MEGGVRRCRVANREETDTRGDEERREGRRKCKRVVIWVKSGLDRGMSRMCILIYFYYITKPLAIVYF